MKKLLLSILVICAAAIAASAQISVSGVVLDENQAPMPGAAVLLDGATGHGVVTDEKGRYKIVVPSSESILRFEFMGYSSVKMKVGNKSELNVTLNPDVSFLEEVVVIGFGEAKKSDLTGSVGTVQMKDIIQSPSLSVDQALQGRVAGADIVSMSGDPT